MSLLVRDLSDVEALVTDRYLDALLAARDDADAAAAAMGASGRRGPRTTPQRLDGAVRLASERLTRDLPQFHPSFRFEERLAVRLAEAAAAMRLPAAAGAEGGTATIPFPSRGSAVSFDPFADPDDHDPVSPGVPLPLLIRGAVAASAISLAGAAVMAWRRSHPGVSPMARAARAAHALRERPV